MMKIFNFFRLLLQKILIFCIRIYKRLISPLLPNACRFQPTCSEYMIEAIQKRGILVGLYLGIRRILRCNPWGESGYDPVPDRKTKDKDTD